MPITDKMIIFFIVTFSLPNISLSKYAINNMLEVIVSASGDTDAICDKVVGIIAIKNIIFFPNGIIFIAKYSKNTETSKFTILVI